MHNSTLAVLFPTLTAALTMIGVELGADPVFIVLTSPLIVAYPFIWAWDYVFHDGGNRNEPPANGSKSRSKI